jgi:hypothetical protein
MVAISWRAAVHARSANVAPSLRCQYFAVADEYSPFRTPIEVPDRHFVVAFHFWQAASLTLYDNMTDELAAKKATLFSREQMTTSCRHLTSLLPCHRPGYGRLHMRQTPSDSIIL